MTNKTLLSMPLFLAMLPFSLTAQTIKPGATAIAAKSQKVIIDTDAGDDVDDVFALGLALSSPELNIVGITTSWVEPKLKARLIDRLLCETGRTEIPVAVGIDPHPPKPVKLSQARWAARQPETAHPDAVDFLLNLVRQNPGEITLIALGPLTNVGAEFQRDPDTFRKLKRIVMMGGSVRRGYGDASFKPAHGPDPEYNIEMDIPAAQAVFSSGVPIYVMPLDSTQIKLDDYKRQILFTLSTNLTDAMSLLYEQWSVGHHLVEPTMYDDVAVAYAIDPSICPVTPMHIDVDAKGYTREVSGKANVSVCLNSSADVFFDFYMPRILKQRLSGACPALKP